ncbi:MAG: hypothetical protein E7291_01990 [Lachnospiraceae bacterium]|nr:hypothetical protein [Lachnospiraceae bacterium]
MEENRRKLTWKNILPELGIMLLAATGIYIHGLVNSTNMDVILRNMVTVALGIAILGYALRQEYLNYMLAYNNSEHLLRFWVAVVIGLLISFACIFLPMAGWPFLTIYVMLTLYSSLSIGILSGSVLLIIPTLLATATADVFFLYFVSGVFAAYLFRNLENEFTIGIPWLLSMMCLLVCETANIVLVANEHLSFELFVVPIINIIISSILLIGFLKIFSATVVYQYRESYLDINDTENPILVEYKQNNRTDYFLCVHTTYFCERIASKLSLDIDALKCAGYYHKLYSKLAGQENAPAFPPQAVAILQEYQEKRNAVEHKETAVLLCADAIVSTIIFMFSKNGDKVLDYEQVIDAVFKKFYDAGTFHNCDITMRELKTMQKIFKEEKLYYDFLR